VSIYWGNISDISVAGVQSTM